MVWMTDELYFDGAMMAATAYSLGWCGWMLAGADAGRT
jgi:hypothetical protein